QQNCQNKPLCDDPVLQKLERHVALRAQELGPEKVAVIFLGDNIYPAGLNPKKGSEFQAGSWRLSAQVDVARRSGVRGWFVPGNHDWNTNEVGGFERIRAQAEFLAAVTDARVAMRPRGACSGPDVETLGGALSVVFVDTAWWLHPAKDRPGSPPCNATTEAAAAEALRLTLTPLNARRTIIVSHHPFEKSVGRHGTSGSGKQDFASTENRRMRTALQKAVTDSGLHPLMWAAGHDHSLQILRGEKVAIDVVSGLGYSRKSTGVTCTADVVYASERPGYMVLDIPTDPAAQPRLEVRELNGPAAPFSMRLP
ncbi:MAG TPA: hypothetical protein VGR02_11965, partial [Thermoanaerobaculia bacterium]|nr:hypothetical protein [Thermoanaerobaculia bacterium]